MRINWVGCQDLQISAVLQRRCSHSWCFTLKDLRGFHNNDRESLLKHRASRSFCPVQSERTQRDQTVASRLRTPTD
ncbi:hypothetical protein AGOR_G00088220 [Albula goreensis]|uniref:Uncharacterized protein n=1 Tax=Albula goreensis TaxID=1534307 RepID=A0A8T3DRD9_9TELE|nr:hypothetical protein AGOR_G00088220 [Albula goreensis]